MTWSDGGVSAYGNGNGYAAHIVFRDPSAEWAVLWNPELAIGEAYMDGRIVFPDDSLLDFLMLLNENWNEVRHRRLFAWLSRLRFMTRRFAQNNSPLRARNNVKHHYDLDGRIYRLFLDSDMQYSCAYFDRPDADLEEAQWAKKRHLASKLALRPGQQVLDIGSGWGGLGLFLADYFDVDVTGVTLSTEQHTPSPTSARASAGWTGGRASSSRTIARSTRNSTASSPSACSSMWAPRAIGEFFRSVDAAPEGRRRDAASFDRPLRRRRP